MKNPFKNLKLKKDKDNQIQREKYKYVSVLRMLSIFTIAVLVFTVFGTIFFVYTSIVSTIGQVQSIALYQSELRVELIDFNLLAETEMAWEKKFEAELPAIKRNPFDKIIEITTEKNAE